MSPSIELWTQRIQRHGDAETAQQVVSEVAQWLRQVDLHQVPQLLAAIADLWPSSGPNQRACWLTVLQAVDDWRRSRQEPPGDLLVERIVQCYKHLRDQRQAAAGLLAWLTQTPSTTSLGAFAEIVCQIPPADERVLAAAISGLFQRTDWPVSAVFPRLLDALSDPVAAPLVMDLANRVTREKMVEAHPAAPRHHDLMLLLEALIQQLEQSESEPLPSGPDAEKKSQNIFTLVSLTVSLCDAAALIQNQSAVSRLYRALELKHRRIRTEAAAALAALGEEAGRQTLLELAAEPVARLRVLAYADEFGFLDQVPAEYQTEVARAEAELALALAQIPQMGFPPARLELLDQRRQYWPGYDEEVPCFLFRYVYELGAQVYSNVGIVGPVTHALSADLQDLPPDDIYAIYAGWDAEHDELGQWPVAQLPAAETAEVARLTRRLKDAGYGRIEPLVLGRFFGDRLLVAQASRGQTVGIAVADAHEVLFSPRTGKLRPLGAEEAIWIYQGRRLLRAFN